MYFQVVDDKKECVAFYSAGALKYEDIDEKCKRTWGYTSSLFGKDIEFANLYVSGAPLADHCPEVISERFEKINEKLKAFSESIKTADIDMRDHCLFDLIPEKHICELLECRNIITQHVFENYKKPENYNHLLGAVRLVDDIGCEELNIDFARLKKDYHDQKVRRFLKKVKGIEHCVSYNVFGSKTGRLTTNKRSFPILNLDKDLRKYVKPRNDLFVELDFNAAELRTLLALSGKPQPQLDIHEWNLQNLSGHSTTREEIKKRTFAWLYNPEARDRALERLYNRDWVKDNYRHKAGVRTPFSRYIEADDRVALNYIVQSTSSDMCIEQAIKVNNFLEKRRSNIVFLMHDSIVVDCCASDKADLMEILSIFGATRFGDYRVNLSIGKNFGEMRKVNWIQ
ncbi:MAG: hypothetical protein HOJ16_08670 [Candidatus Peribacter sp.]|jgi:hypothetical protein|nr:hypothetical protein [Candidatus Peribacter sp.]